MNKKRQRLPKLICSLPVQNNPETALNYEYPQNGSNDNDQLKIQSFLENHASFNGTTSHCPSFQDCTTDRNLFFQTGTSTFGTNLTSHSFGTNETSKLTETEFIDDRISNLQRKTELPKRLSSSIPNLQPSPLSSKTRTNETETNNCRQHPLPQGMHNYPYNFKNLRFNGNRFLKPLNWYDTEIMQIIKDILDRDLTVNAAINRIYYITGDRPSKRILQQRVRRFREFRMKEGNPLIFEKRHDNVDEMKLADSSNSFDERNSTFSSSFKEENKTGTDADFDGMIHSWSNSERINLKTDNAELWNETEMIGDKSMIQSSSKIVRKNKKTRKAKNYGDTTVDYCASKNKTDNVSGGYGYGSSKIIDKGPISMVKVESLLTPNLSSVDETLRNFHFSTPDSFDASFLQNFNLTGSLYESSSSVQSTSKFSSFTVPNYTTYDCISLLKFGNLTESMNESYASNVSAQVPFNSSSTVPITSAVIDGTFVSKTAKQYPSNPVTTVKPFVNFESFFYSTEPEETGGKFSAFNCAADVQGNHSTGYFSDLLPPLNQINSNSNFKLPPVTSYPKPEKLESYFDSLCSSTSGTSRTLLNPSMDSSHSTYLPKTATGETSSNLTTSFANCSNPLIFDFNQNYSSSTFGYLQSLPSNTAPKPYQEPSKIETDQISHKMDFPFTAQKIDALIASIDHDWIQKLLDENNKDDIGDDTPKILNPANMKTLCINIENILNFMKQSIFVLIHSKHTVIDPKDCKTFGEVLKDLLKLKEVYEIYEDEKNATKTVMNRQSFVYDVMKWICGSQSLDEAFDSTKVPQTNLNITQFQRLIKFLKDFNSNMFDYATNYEALYNNIDSSYYNPTENVSKLSSVLANCVLIIVEVVACVTVADGIGWNDSLTLAAL